MIPWRLLSLLMGRIRWLLLIRWVAVNVRGRSPLVWRTGRRSWRTTRTRTTRWSARSRSIVCPLLPGTLRWILPTVLSARARLPTAWVHLGSLVGCVRLLALFEVRMAPGLVWLWVGKRLFLLLTVVIGR